MKGLRTLKRRRRESKTDYKARKILLESNIPRIAVRLTNRYYIVQAIESHEAQDKVLATITSKNLIKNGWDAKKAGSLKSIPAGYLTGILMAKKLLSSSSKKSKFIIDLGMARTEDGGRVFSVIKGLIDGGLNISANERIFPSEERLAGEHMKDDMKAMIKKVKEGLN